MTTIVSNLKGMASDTLLSFDTGEFLHCQKIYRLPNGDLVGLAGDNRECLEMLDWFKGDMRDEDRPYGLEGACALYLGSNGIVNFGGDCFPVPNYGDVAAIGSGAPAAMGAISMGATLKEAIEAANKVNLFSDGYEYYPLKQKRKKIRKK